MKLESFKEAKNMPEKYLPSLVDAEIECWGSRPFSEFRICKNDKCRVTYSIEDVYGSVEKYQKMREQGFTIDQFDCHECNSETGYVYEKEEFIKLMHEQIKKQLSLVLALTNEEIVRGFGVLSNTNVKGLINLELNTREGSYNKQLLLNLISKIIFNVYDASNNEVKCLHHIFVGNELRDIGYGKIILNAMLEFLKTNNNSPIFLETKKNCNGYILAKKMGFDELISDSYGYTIMYLGVGKCNYSNIINNLLTNSKNVLIN